MTTISSGRVMCVLWGYIYIDVTLVEQPAYYIHKPIAYMSLCPLVALYEVLFKKIQRVP